MVLLSLGQAGAESSSTQGKFDRSSTLGNDILQLLTGSQLAVQTQAEPDEELKAYRFSLLRRSALALIDFVIQLAREHFLDFWLPCEWTSR